MALHRCVLSACGRLWYPLAMSLDLDALLSASARRGASDLLLVAGTAPAIRLHGDLTPAEGADGALGRDDVPNLLASVIPERRTASSVTCAISSLLIGMVSQMAWAESYRRSRCSASRKIFPP